MASNYASVKLSSDFVDEARQAAAVLHRSPGAQAEYWARLGRAIEHAPGFSIGRVRQALEGRLRLETLSVAGQDAVLEGLGAEFDQPRTGLRGYFAAPGTSEGAGKAAGLEPAKDRK